MIRIFLVIFFVAFVVVNSQSQAETYEWQGYCLPKNLLTPESYMQPSSDDANYDSDDGFGPSVFFNNEYLAEKIDGYSKTFISDGSMLLAHIMPNLSTQPLINVPSFEHSIAFQAKETDLLIFNRGESKWEWTAFEKVGADFKFWGTCSIIGVESYHCMREANINGLSVSYIIKDVNIAKYKEVDNLIKQHLDSWQCK